MKCVKTCKVRGCSDLGCVFSKEGEWFLWYQDHLFVIVCIVIYDWLLVEPSGCFGNWM